jgi:hypothetical protein
MHHIRQRLSTTPTMSRVSVGNGDVSQPLTNGNTVGADVSANARALQVRLDDEIKCRAKLDERLRYERTYKRFMLIL